MTKHMSGKICMVTGATSGIGEATAFALAKQGADVVVVGRNPRKGADTVNKIKSKTGNSSVKFLKTSLLILYGDLLLLKHWDGLLFR